MKKLNVFENVKADDVISISLKPSATTGEPTICIKTHSEGEIRQKITEGFEVFNCNEFLRSLKLAKPDYVEFTSFAIYEVIVNNLNTYLGIKRIMEKVSGVKYDDIRIYAGDVYICILDRLLAKHHMALGGWEKAMQKRPLEEWVKEAITYLS